MRNKESKLNNRGFTLFELMIVVTIMAIVASISSASLVSIYHARAKKAADQIAAVLSQSKIDALSGRNNYMSLSYSDEDGCYLCRLFKCEDISDTADAELYDTEFVGNDRVSISIIGDDGLTSKAISGTAELIVQFNNNNGSARVDCSGVSCGKKCVIRVASGSQYDVTLYCVTGENEVLR